MKFTKKTLNKMLNQIIEEYFSEDTVENGYGLWEVVEYVKAKYQEEINTLGE